MDEQGEGAGAGPGAIAAELGNGAPNGRRGGEEGRPGSDSKQQAAGRSGSCDGAELGEQERHLADPGANFLCRPVMS